MKMIRFSQTFWHCVNGASVPQFEAGKDYPDNVDTQRCIARGIAEEVEVPDPQPAAEGAPTSDSAAATDAAAVAVDPTVAPAAEAKPAKAKK